MASEQLSILFDDEDPKKKQKRKPVSKKNTMQSEEEWTPRATETEEQQKPSEGQSDEAKPKARPRGRKPRAPKKAVAAEEAKSEPAAEKPAPERKPRAEKPAQPQPQPERAAAPAPAESREAAPAPEEREAGEKREQPGRTPRGHEHEREGDRSARHEGHRGSQREGGGRDERQHGHHEGGGRDDRQQHQRQPEGDPRDRFGNFRNKKKKKSKKGRFERGGGGGGGGPERGGGGGGGGGGGPQQQIAHRIGDLPDPNRLQNLEELKRQAEEIGAGGEPLYMDELFNISLHDLVERAKAMEVVLDTAPNRRILIARMLEKAFEEKRPIIDRGVLEITDRGFGFIARHSQNYKVQPEDPYLAASFVRRYGLKKGHQVEAQVRPPEGDERCPAVLQINQVMGRNPEEVADIVPFEDLVPYYPLQRILLEVPDQENQKDVSMRAVDLLTPIGFGQRGLIVAPPRTGKTVLLQQIANSIATNQPDAHLMILLVDERPEEVTDFRRNTRGEVVSSTFDEAASSHVEVAEMVIEKARRMVEVGKHVVILLDSITRLARAYNTMMPSSGKILSGGVESNALQKPKRFFGAARNIEDGGSLTILATALIDTGSRMDEVIFEEFKGTGNMELHLDRALVDKRIYPALNIEKSGTRKEELLYHPEELNRIYSLRRAVQGVPMVEAMEMLVQRLKKTKSNAEFLLAMNR